jgi:beta-lactamase class A
MLTKKIPAYLSFLFLAVGALASYFVVKTYFDKEIESSSSSPVPTPNCPAVPVRLNGYQYIKPLLFVDEPCPSPRFEPLKNQLASIISSYKNSGTAQSVSLYVRNLNNGEWMGIAEDEKYLPGSLLKVPELITFMKMRENNPSLFEKKIDYSQPLILPKRAFHISKTLEPGKIYSIKDLLYYMIAYSDNEATYLLNKLMDNTAFKKVFTDLGMPDPDLTKNDIPISAKEYSLFMRALYNATYLTISDSEFSTELLSHSDFKDGLMSGLPEGLKVAHKFGEAGGPGFFNFSESGIIYLNNSPYLITIMTKGPTLENLPPIVSSISQKVFEVMRTL